MVSKKTMEINPDHPIVAKMDAETDEGFGEPLVGEQIFLDQGFQQVLYASGFRPFLANSAVEFEDTVFAPSEEPVRESPHLV